MSCHNGKQPEKISPSISIQIFDWHESLTKQSGIATGIHVAFYQWHDDQCKYARMKETGAFINRFFCVLAIHIRPETVKIHFSGK